MKQTQNKSKDSRKRGEREKCQWKAWITHKHIENTVFSAQNKYNQKQKARKKRAREPEHRKKRNIHILNRSMIQSLCIEFALCTFFSSLFFSLSLSFFFLLACFPIRRSEGCLVHFGWMHCKYSGAFFSHFVLFVSLSLSLSLSLPSLVFHLRVPVLCVVCVFVYSFLCISSISTSFYVCAHVFYFVFFHVAFWNGCAPGKKLW